MELLNSLPPQARQCLLEAAKLAAPAFRKRGMLPQVGRGRAGARAGGSALACVPMRAGRPRPAWSPHAGLPSATACRAQPPSPSPANTHSLLPGLPVCPQREEDKPGAAGAAAPSSFAINVDASGRELPSLDDPLIATLIVDPAMAGDELGAGPVGLGSSGGGGGGGAGEPGSSGGGRSGGEGGGELGTAGKAGGSGGGDDKAQLLDLIRWAPRCCFSLISRYSLGKMGRSWLDKDGAWVAAGSGLCHFWRSL